MYYRDLTTARVLGHGRRTPFRSTYGRSCRETHTHRAALFLAKGKSQEEAKKTDRKVEKETVVEGACMTTLSAALCTSRLTASTLESLANSLFPTSSTGRYKG